MALSARFKDALNQSQNIGTRDQILTNQGYATSNTAATLAPLGTAPVSTNMLANPTPLNIPQLSPNTSNSAVFATTNPILDEATATVQGANIASGATNTQNQIDAGTQYVESLFGDKNAVLANQASSEEEKQLLQANNDLTDLNKKIADTQVALRAEQDTIKGRGDITKEGQAGLLNNVEEKYSRNLADLAIRQAAATGNISRLEATSDRKTQMLLAPIDNKIKYYTDYVQKNLDSLSNKQIAQANQIIQQQNKLKEEITATEQAKTSLLIEASKNGVKLSSEIVAQITSAGSAQEAVAVLARNGISLQDPKDVELRQAQINSANRANQSSVNSGAVYATDLDAIIGATVSTIPSKFGQETFNNQIKNARNDEDRINLVAAQVLKGQSSEFKKDFASQAVGVSQIDKAIKLLDEGVKTGVINNAAQYVYNLSGKDFDPKLAQINGLLVSAIQPYRSSVTGAAWGSQEDAEYEQLFGSTKYSPTELRQRLVQTKELMKSKSSEGLNAFVNPLGYNENVFIQDDKTANTSTDSNKLKDPLGLFN